jgi:hypothetical protein
MAPGIPAEIPTMVKIIERYGHLTMGRFLDISRWGYTGI